MLLVSDMVTKKGDRIGDRKIKAITPVSADKIYELILQGPRGERARQGEKAVALCRRAWRIVHRLYPDQFDRAVPNPWDGVTKQPRRKKAKAAVTRTLVYRFAWGCLENNQPGAAAAAVICFEWLRRPENVLAGYIRWTDYRGADWPNAIKIEHHKTGAVVWHPLEDENGTKFYAEAEAVLERLPRLGIPDDFARGQEERNEAIFVQPNAEDRPHDARQARTAFIIHARCLPPRWHDGIGRSGAD